MFSTYSFVPKLMAAVVILVIQVIPSLLKLRIEKIVPPKLIYLPLVATSRAISAKHKFKDVYIFAIDHASGSDTLVASFAFGSAQSLGMPSSKSEIPSRSSRCHFVWGNDPMYLVRKGRAYGLRLLDSRINAGAGFERLIREEDHCFESPSAGSSNARNPTASAGPELGA